MPNAFIRKLDGFERLHDDDREWFLSLTDRAKHVDADQDLIREGDNPQSVKLIVDGFAMRYKMTSDGRRQIFAYLIPGDFCDLHVALLRRMDHSIATFSPCQVVELSPATVVALTERRPALARALWMCTLVDEGTLREWLLNIGQRSAARRIAHLFCEIHERMKAVGLASEGFFELPLTQTELGDTMGLSIVHVNRSLKDLREKGLVTLHNGRIAIPDAERLERYAGFDPSYLHVRHPPGTGIK